MDPLVAFAITLALITVVSLRYRISPFFTLIGGAILFGLLAGMTTDTTMLGIIAGILGLSIVVSLISPPKSPARPAPES